MPWIFEELWHLCKTDPCNCPLFLAFVTAIVE
jgi:hypothetical protein